MIFTRRPAALTTATAGLLACALVSLTGPGATATHRRRRARVHPGADRHPGRRRLQLPAQRQGSPTPARPAWSSSAVAEAGGVVVQPGRRSASSWRTPTGLDVPRRRRRRRRQRRSSPSAPRARVPVSEGTPASVGAPWGRGASGYKKGAKKDVNGDVGTEPTAATAADPREAEQWDMQMIKADQAHADHRRQPQRRSSASWTAASTPTTRTSPPTSTSPTR